MITIIPAIDIIDGKCVRLSLGEYSTKKVYNENPLEVAKAYEDAGIKRLHLVDLDGAKQKHIVNWKILKKVSDKTKLRIDFGGGIRSNKDAALAFDSGASQITAGSIAVSNKELVLEWAQKYGSDKIIIGADVKDKMIAINAWQNKTQYNLFSFIDEYKNSGFKDVICTDISKDGMLEGPAFELYENIKNKFPELNLIASGGISDIADIEKLNEMNIDGVIIGKALYEGKINLNQLKKYNAD